MGDVVIIGAGIGGLSAAIVLAAGGKDVAVFESHSQPGGKAATVQLDGVTVDTGPSVLTMVDVFRDVFAAAGRSFDDMVQLRKPEPSFRYLYPDGVILNLHHDLDATLQEIGSSLGSTAAGEFERFVAYSGTIWEAAAPNFVFGPAPDVTNLLKRGWSAMRSVAKIDPLNTMWSAIRKRVKSPHLRSLFGRYATYNGSDMRRAPATLNCIAHVELALGGYGVQGGMYALVEALVEVAVGLGVTIHLNDPVQHLLFNENRVRGVRLAAGQEVGANVVVANADFSAVRERLVPQHLRARLAEPKEPSMSGFNAMIRARRRVGTDARAAHTVIFPDDYEAEFADVFDRKRAPETPTVYLCAQEACHGRRGWELDEPVFMMANAPAVSDRRPQQYKTLEEKCVSRTLKFGLQDVADSVVWRRTPLDLAERFEGSRGALYGAASNNAAAAFQRPANTVKGLPGLYLASGSVHPGGGVPMAALSGQAAAREVLGR